MSRAARWLPWMGPMLLGLTLRLPGLEARPIWYDEAFSILLAARPPGQVLSGTAADTMPPLYYLILGVWQSLGDSIAGQRSLNVILGVALVGLVYCLGNELYGRKAGTWAATLAAISPLLVYHAQELRMYTLLTLALTAYLYAIVLARRVGGGKGAWLPWIGVVGAGTLALYTHNLAIFSLAAVDVFLLLRREWSNLGRLVLSQLVMVVLFLPWLRYVPGQIQKIQDAFWTPRPGGLEIVQAVVTFHSSLPLSSLLLVLGVAASLTAMTLTVYVMFRRLSHTWRDGLLACVVLAPPILLFLASYLMRPVFVPRAFTLSLIGYLLLAGRALAEARPRPVMWAMVASFAVAAVVGLWAQANHRTFPRSPFREAAGYLEETGLAGDVILHSNKLSYFPMHVYAPALSQSFLGDEPGSHNDTLAPATQEALGLFPVADFESAASGARRLRFVIFQRELDEYAESALMPPTLRWMATRGLEPRRTAFQDLWIYDFDLPS
jgi:uncharacterized membrane protein